jgi:hypothetical protein
MLQSATHQLNAIHLALSYPSLIAAIQQIEHGLLPNVRQPGCFVLGDELATLGLVQYPFECVLVHEASALSWATPRKPERIRAKVKMPIPIDNETWVRSMTHSPSPGDD